MEIVAGWVAGYAMALITTIALTYLVLQMREAPLLQRWVSGEVPGVLLAVPVSLGSMLGWTMIGIVIGSVYRVGDLGSQPDALGSPSYPFSLAMVIVALFPLLPLLLLAPRYWWVWAGLSASFAGLFGWLMPVLAAR